MGIYHPTGNLPEVMDMSGIKIRDNISLNRRHPQIVAVQSEALE